MIDLETAEARAEMVFELMNTILTECHGHHPQVVVGALVFALRHVARSTMPEGKSKETLLALINLMLLASAGVLEGEQDE